MSPSDIVLLVVDDSSTDRQYLVTWLQQRGFKTVEAADGKDAVAKARLHKPDAILMDVMMPEINGFEATRKLHDGDDTKIIPVIMVSTREGDTDRLWAKRQGAAAYITKPVDRNELMFVLGKCLNMKF